MVYPAEWAEQDSILLTWPHRETDWAPLLKEAEQTCLEIARKIIQYESLLITAKDKNQVKDLFTAREAEKIRFFEIPCNDTWARDFGPICTFTGNRKIIHKFRFNGWGNKFEASLDDQIVKELFLLNAFHHECEMNDHAGFILEGGSIESDGKGTIMTTRQCLLNPNRNSRLSEKEIELYLSESLGAQRILWLGHGHLEGDDTDGHIDTLARFCNENTICYVKGNGDDAGLKMMEEQLKSFRKTNGQPYNLVALPVAEPVFDPVAGRLPATYANFLIINQAVLVPVYGTKTDTMALEIFRQLFPGRDVTGINCSTLIKQGGSLHCMTMQIPKGFLNETRID